MATWCAAVQLCVRRRFRRSQNPVHTARVLTVSNWDRPMDSVLHTAFEDCSAPAAVRLASYHPLTAL